MPGKDDDSPLCGLFLRSFVPYRGTRRHICLESIPRMDIARLTGSRKSLSGKEVSSLLVFLVFALSSNARSRRDTCVSHRENSTTMMIFP